MEEILVSPRKKRCPPLGLDEDTIVTPKKLRTQAYLIPTPSSQQTSLEINEDQDLPASLQRLLNLQVMLNQVLAHTLATSGIYPTEDTGIVPNVINHFLLTKRGFHLQDLRRLCWIWEWNGKPLQAQAHVKQEDENPFVEPTTPKPKTWQRGAMGMILRPSTHLDRELGQRVASYGIGVEVEMNIDKGFTDGMAAIARWSAAGGSRKKAVTEKLIKWTNLHASEDILPFIPLADLPALQQPARATILLQRQIASPSPSPTKALRSQVVRQLNTSPAAVFTQACQAQIKPAVPKAPTNRLVFFPPLEQADIPQTPRRKATYSNSTSSLHSSDPSLNQTILTPKRPSTPATPSSERRAALYERVRQRSLSHTPRDPAEGGTSREQFQALSIAAMRRRCLLGRLPNVAEGIWMLFAGPVSATQERRVLRLPSVIHSVVKSSPIPMSDSDAEESISLLVELCPFYLRKIIVNREEWLEIPHSDDQPPSKLAETSNCDTQFNQPPASLRMTKASASPSTLDKAEVEERLLAKSPRGVRKPKTTLSLVRERIRRELESME